MQPNGWGENMPEIAPGKNFSSSVNFVSVGPIPVQVTGINGEDLGVGRLIGIVHRSKKGNAHVLSLTDPISPDGETELLSTECSYDSLMDEKIDKILSTARTENPVSPSQYLISLLDQGVET